MIALIRLLFSFTAGMLCSIMLTLTGTATAGEVIRDHPVVHGVIAKATGRPCLYDETVSNCFWNARKQGDGTGHSFYSVRVGHRFCAIYWNEQYNRKHGTC